MVRREELPNGLTLLVREMHAAPVVAMTLWVGAGAADDPPELSGVSHFLEHMVLKGRDGTGPGELTRAVQDVGGYLNARTGYDHTAFYQVVPSRHWREVLERQAGVLSEPRFQTEDVDGERRVILEELGMAERDPSSFLWRRLFESSLGGGPYGRHVTGTAETLARVSPDDLLDHYGRGYVAPNMVQVIVGDIDADEALNVAARVFGDWREGPPRASQTGVPDVSFWPSASIFRAELKQPYVLIAFGAPAACAPGMPTLDAVSNMLGRGRSSRLRKRLRTSMGIVADIETTIAGFRDIGVFAVRIVGTQGADPSRVVEEVFREIRRLKDAPVSDGEMSKSLRRLESAYVLEHETAESVAMTLGFFETLGSYEYSEEYVDLIAAVTPGDISRATTDYLRPGIAGIAAYVPGSDATTASSLEESALAGFERAGSPTAAERTSAWRVVAPFARPSMIHESRPCVTSRVTLEGGATLVVRESPGLPLVSVAFGFSGGFTDEPDERLGLTNAMLKHQMRGTRTRSPDVLVDDIEGLGSAISTTVDRDGFGLGATVLSKHIREAMDVIADVVTAPGMLASEFERVRNEVRAEIGEAEDNPYRRSLLRLIPLLFPGHPYGRRISGTLETLSFLKPGDTAAWHANSVALSNLTVCMVGDVSLKAAREVIERAVTGMKRAGAASEGVGAPGAPRGAHEEPQREEGQSSVAVGYPGPAAGTGESVALQVASAALTMMGGRLWGALRERPPFAYAVRAAPLPLRSGGAFVGYVTTPPGQEEAAVDTFISELRRLADDGLSEGELSRAKEHLAGIIEISMQRGATVAASYALAEVMGLGYERIDAMPAAVRATTGSDVLDVARKYLTAEDGPARVILRG